MRQIIRKEPYILLPFVVGLPLAAQGVFGIYSGYKSKSWPSTEAVVTSFEVQYLHEQDEEEEDEGSTNKDYKASEVGYYWKKLRSLFVGEETFSGKVHFGYTLEDKDGNK